MTGLKIPVRVRMAPSPTGHWHLGGVRTALFNWLYARQHGGAFVLRIEDTDKARSAREYETEIVDTLKWLNLDWDEGPGKGEYGPYRQSERISIYREYLQKLIRENKSYYCYCTKEDLEAERQYMIASGIAPKYSGNCREVVNPPTGKNPQVIRFRIPEGKVEFNDLIRGKVSFDGSLFGDVVIAKDLDSPLYNFAVVVDDELMKISHVIRGEEHLSNTPKQIFFQHALGFKEPIYGHLPLILAENRSKLSKRYTEASILQYRENGYLPDALLNFLALLGWHPENDREILSLDELVREFDIKRTQKAGAAFNVEKLDWLNSQRIKKMDINELLVCLEPFLKEKEIVASKDFLGKIVEAERERAKTLKDFIELADFFFELPDYDPKLLLWKDELPQNIKDSLAESNKILNGVSENNFKKEVILAALNEHSEKYGKGTVLWPLRVAVSGKQASPDPMLIMEILGKKETEGRVKIALNKADSLIS